MSATIDYARAANLAAELLTTVTRILDIAERRFMRMARAERVDSGRRCEECSLCCTVMAVEELAKPRDHACSHLAGSAGCSIYGRRPPTCAGYECFWRSGFLPAEWKPSRIGMILDVSYARMRDGAAEIPVLTLREAESGAFKRDERTTTMAMAVTVGLGARLLMPFTFAAWNDKRTGGQPYMILGGEERVAELERQSAARGRKLIREAK